MRTFSLQSNRGLAKGLRRVQDEEVRGLAPVPEVEHSMEEKNRKGESGSTGSLGKVGPLVQFLGEGIRQEFLAANTRRRWDWVGLVREPGSGTTAPMTCSSVSQSFFLR